MESKTNILIVDDMPANLVVLEAVLDRPDYNLVPAKSGEEALEALQRNNIAVILLDVRMPGMDGFETATIIKRQDKHQFIPIIFISASFMDEQSIQRGYAVGGVEYLVKPFDTKALQAKVAFFVDLHRKNMKSEEQAQLEKNLIEQDRARALENLQIEKDLREKFVATLAHDLRNPIAAAKMSAQLIERNPSTIEANRKHVRRLLSNIDRADHMIENLLDANRLRAGESLPVSIAELDLPEVIQEVSSDLTSIYGPRFVVNAPPTLKGFWCKTGIQRILENLMGNGVKYGAPHKPVTVSVDDEDIKVKLKVHNDGKPLTPEQQKNIFDLYKRTHDTSSKGWGLGLTLVRGIAESHGGKVDVQSSEAKGTDFIVTLPKDSRPFVPSKARGRSQENIPSPSA